MKISEWEFDVYGKFRTFAGRSLNGILRSDTKGKSQALYRTKMRNMITGIQFTQTYRSNDKFEEAHLDERSMQFLYGQGDDFHFMDTANYEQVTLTREQLGDNLNYGMASA